MITSDDALADMPAGTVINVSPLDYGSVQAATTPQSVANWGAFDGSLLAVCLKYGGTYVIEGTAVMIGLGIAFSAKHVFDDHRDALMSGEAVPMCIGLRADGVADIWQCYAMSRDHTDGGDLELLCLRLVSDLPSDRHIKVLPLTTRIPPPGEAVITVGFRFEESVSQEAIEHAVTLGGAMYVSQGSAAQFSYPIHDSVLAPYPTIEILSGTLGGMSGGAVFDVNNHVIGITSRGLQIDDQQGPTLAAWWMTAVFWRTELTWPPGLHTQQATLWEMPTVTIVGREHVQLLDEPNFALARWT